MAAAAGPIHNREQSLTSQKLHGINEVGCKIACTSSSHQMQIEAV